MNVGREEAEMEEQPPLRLDVTPYDPSNDGSNDGSVDGDDTHAGDPEPPRRIQLLIRALIGVAVVAALAFTITTVVNSRVEASREAAEAEDVNLVVGSVGTQSRLQADDTVALQVELYNAGPLAVTVVSAGPTGWEPAADSAALDRVIQPGTAENMTTMTTAACDDAGSEMPDTLDVVVEASSGNRHELTLRRMLNRAPGALVDPCWIFESTADTFAWVWVEDIVAGDVIDESVVMRLDMSIEIEGTRSGHTFTATGLTANAPGFAVEVPELPIDLTPGTFASVDTVWRVTDCDVIGAQTDDDPLLVFDVESDEADISIGDGSGDVWMPTTGAMALGRLAGEVC
jgi:hypothetical protein